MHCCITRIVRKPFDTVLCPRSTNIMPEVFITVNTLIIVMETIPIDQGPEQLLAYFCFSAFEWNCILKFNKFKCFSSQFVICWFYNKDILVISEMFSTSKFLQKIGNPFKCWDLLTLAFTWQRTFISPVLWLWNAKKMTALCLHFHCIETLFQWTHYRIYPPPSQFGGYKHFITLLCNSFECLFLLHCILKLCLDQHLAVAFPFLSVSVPIYKKTSEW